MKEGCVLGIVVKVEIAVNLVFNFSIEKWHALLGALGRNPLGVSANVSQRRERTATVISDILVS